jgi:hypothetical protein
MPAGSFGHVPTPALVAPLEFTLPREDYLALGGHERSIRPLAQVLREGGEYGGAWRAVGPCDPLPPEEAP